MPPRSLFPALLCLALCFLRVQSVRHARPAPVLAKGRATPSVLEAGVSPATSVLEAVLESGSAVSTNALIGYVVIALCLLGFLACLDKKVFCMAPCRSLLDDWIEGHEEDAVEPDLVIFDPHHHLWDFSTQPKAIPQFVGKILYSFRPKVRQMIMGADAKMAQTFGQRMPLTSIYMEEHLMNDIKGSGKGHKVSGTCYMECGWEDKTVSEPALRPVGEAAMVTDVHKRHPQICQGIVAFADLSLGAAVEPALQTYAQNPLVKGVRFALAWSEDPGLMAGSHAKKGIANTPEFRKGFALLAKHGLSYDCWLYHEQIPDLIDLAHAFPETTVICDHNALPLGVGSYSKDKVFPEWKAMMTRLAGEKNVVVKLSGLPMRVCGFGFDEREVPASSDELAQAWAPYITFVLETFGVERCMFASNFPVDKVAGSFTTLFNAYKKIVANYSPEDKQKLFELNAKRVYRI